MKRLKSLAIAALMAVQFLVIPVIPAKAQAMPAPCDPNGGYLEYEYLGQDYYYDPAKCPDGNVLDQYYLVYDWWYGVGCEEVTFEYCVTL